MIGRQDRPRTGMALFVVLFAVFILSIILIALWTEFFSELRQTSKMQDDTHHFYLAEAVLAKGINKVKKKPWMERFYAKDARVARAVLVDGRGWQERVPGCAVPPRDLGREW